MGERELVRDLANPPDRTGDDRTEATTNVALDPRDPPDQGVRMTKQRRGGE